MNLIILAAGTGQRLLPLTKDTPKSLIGLGDGTTLLARQINNAENSGRINKIYIITGYKSHKIEAYVLQYPSVIPIETIFNPFFDMSNNLFSLWCAHYILEQDDFIISNGDNIYKGHVYPRITDTKTETIQLTIDRKNHYDHDDMKVCLRNGHVVRVSKEINPKDANAESVGLVLVQGKKNRSLIREKLLSMVKHKENMQKFWLELFNELVFDQITIDTCEIGEDDWGEIDYHPDVNQIQQEIIKNLF